MDFQLIETMLYEGGEIFLLEEHLNRLEKSAGYFAFEYDRTVLAAGLESIIRALDPSGKYRVRLLLSRAAAFDITTDMIDKESAEPVPVAISNTRTSKDDIFLRHKTTHRETYNAAFKKAREKGLYDLLFLNTDEEVTEGAISNVYIKKNGTYYTPPLSSGVLPGVFREYLLAKQDFSLEEKVLRVEDLKTADELYVSNSVRKLIKVKLV